MPRLVVLCLSLFLVLPGLVLAAPVSIGETTTLQSKILDEERQLMISLPPRYDATTARYPVLYLLDPSGRFHHTTGTLSALARTGHVPEMIVVGVVNTDRTRDLTPAWTGEPLEDENDGRNQAIAAGGGADTFLRFLAEELIPHVESTYRTVDYRLFAGHSFGGLFAMHAFVHQPELFDAVVSISPSLWWDHGRLVDETAELFKTRPDLDSVLYTTLADEGGDMVAQFRRLQTLLRYHAPEDLAWHAEVLDGEDHSTIPMPTVYSAARFIYPRWQLPPTGTDGGLEAIDGHYARLSDDYGYSIPTPEATVNQAGYQALGTGEVERALEIFKANVERHPGSSNVYDSLGEALEAAGHLEEALSHYEKALAMAEAAGGDDPNLPFYQQHAEAVREKIEAAD
ncbi:MAG: alpha/beta hydrolase-fold protein [Acidobacteriota bacterium]